MKLGEVVQLGRHRLMCGDAGNPDHVITLFGGRPPPSLIFTSPPYNQNRKYVRGVGDWDTLMRRVFATAPVGETTQILVNLGLVHRDSQIVLYWDHWLGWMRAKGFLHLGWYVWDKLAGLPTLPSHGRLYPAHEFVFHFCKGRRTANKSVASVGAGKRAKAGGLRRNNNQEYRRPDGQNLVTQDMRIADSVVRLTARGQPSLGHPAPFPVGLPAEYIRAYTDPGEVIYDPFSGSGTTIVAAQAERRTCYAMECEPSYCDIAINRYQKTYNQLVLPGVAS